MQPQRYKPSSCGGRGQISTAGPQFTVVFLQESLSFPGDGTDPAHAALSLMCRKGEGPSLQRSPGNFSSPPKPSHPPAGVTGCPGTASAQRPGCRRALPGGVRPPVGTTEVSEFSPWFPCRDTTRGRSHTSSELSIWRVVGMEA